MQAYHLRLFALQLRKKDEDPENLLVWNAFIRD
jgi:hypothetical protein